VILCYSHRNVFHFVRNRLTNERLTSASYVFVTILEENDVCSVPRPSHPLWFDHPCNILWRVQQFTRLLTVQFFSGFLLFPPSWVQIFSSAPGYQTPSSLCSSLKMRYQVSHPCRTIGKVIVLWLLNRDRKRKVSVFFG